MLWAELGISVLIICKFSNEWTCTRKKNVEGVGCGDATALGSNYAVNDQDFHWVDVHEFERHGWSVQDVYLGNPMRHDEKYLLINQGFSGKQRLMPYINRQNNDDLILAIQSANSLARLRKSRMPWYGFVPLSSEASMSFFTVLAKVR